MPTTPVVALQGFFFFHWKEAAQHASLDELEWMREDSRLSEAARDAAVGDLIGLVHAVDKLLQIQAEIDAAYFCKCCGRSLTAAGMVQIRPVVLAAYRWQFIGCGCEDSRFAELLRGAVSASQGERIDRALERITQ